MNVLFKNKPNFTEAPAIKISYNIGSLLDIPTGTFVKGQKNENILNGGLSVLTAIVGRGNSFKSTIMHYMVLSAMSKVSSSNIMPYANLYDTEMSLSRERINKLADNFDEFKDKDLFDIGAISLTDKSVTPGNEWFKLLKDFLKNEKIKNKKDYTFETPFVDKERKPIFTLFPTFGEIDSLTEFDYDSINSITDLDLGDSGANALHMKLGLAKTRLLMELPSICNSASHYMVTTAHIGQDIAMQQTPYAAQTPKKLQHLKSGDSIKGVSNKFFYLPNTLWQIVNSSLLINQSTKGPEYPKERKSDINDSSDLNIVTLKLLRNKFGPSGRSIDLIVSQSEGVLPALTEFHYLKENNRYGIEGNNIYYNMILYPKVKLSRTTVRELIDKDPLLRRAIKITADLLQIKSYYTFIPYEIPDLKDLYEKLDKKYGWEKILNTRDYWTFNNYKHKVPFLSTLDILEAYYDKYTPYFLKDK